MKLESHEQCNCERRWNRLTFLRTSVLVVTFAVMLASLGSLAYRSALGDFPEDLEVLLVIAFTFSSVTWATVMATTFFWYRHRCEDHPSECHDPEVPLGYRAMFCRVCGSTWWERKSW